MIKLKNCLDREKRNFRDYFGSKDCKNFTSDNYPQCEVESYKERSSSKTMMIETIINLFTCTQNSHISEPKLLNNINILNYSDIFKIILSGSFTLSAPEYKHIIRSMI